MKKIVFGILIGVLLSSTVAFGASTIKEAYFNGTLKISVNNSVGDVEIVTVTKEGETYGKNYVSVADYNKLLNDGAGLNLTTDFDQKSGTIVIQSKAGSAINSIMNTGVSVMSEKRYTPDGILIVERDGVDCISINSIYDKYVESVKKSNGYYYVLSAVTIKGQEYPSTAQLKKIPWRTPNGIKTPDFNKTEIVIDNIPIHSTGYIKYNYYLDSIMPIMQTM